MIYRRDAQRRRRAIRSTQARCAASSRHHPKRDAQRRRRAIRTTPSAMRSIVAAPTVAHTAQHRRGEILGYSPSNTAHHKSVTHLRHRRA
ncbi:MAG: hypothetical protein EOQ40_28475 [Mesorhizobium sp.]|uniref:hypothetical protein n=1 Tax=Mesorhizobium sp. TaxID=1871066 RepID=UPI000FE950CD|nr:hypothetical protein [Mesorhizobium sp.]RWB15471.1 MAG: hypothetical protein EOQ40_28475 [Mesorhizobium sp.]